MSRKARDSIVVPAGVEVTLQENFISVKGPKGFLSQEFKAGISVVCEDQKISVRVADGFELDGLKKFQGLYWSLINNMVIGVHSGFEKKLEMVGVGMRASVQQSYLDLSIGVCHPVKVLIPEGIQVAVEKNTLISVKGINKQEVGQFAAVVRLKKPPEPYKGKGIRYANEYVRRKAGKSGKTGKK
ncbi:50S ribosomal protein L6 [Candidatus Clavichlamydia salmonicola]|uniref:Large ribosomal subunit protein uL6 n=1 Tax=Candidatus Clavichlamydia salmonicola TaxID=469812 RepID=A0A1K0JNJ9_9CHLA|nr:50S ribosomal protein L6 [Candidatus Clavichlamydia salmonicola]MBF5050760.1 50S ribosomal protein L6 [Candidatus Clavichlamydia salmonicola]SDA08614.1 50S ribosomal protein L6 [Candidatus Clavichlamydia salmonicola]